MKPTILATTLFGVLVAATPVLDKRYIVTETVLETATVTVTAQRSWGPWKDKPTPSVPQPAPTTSTTQAVAPPPLPSSTQVSTISPAVPSTGGSVSKYADPILLQHNLHRANHSAGALAWDDSLAAIAQEIAASCVYAHNTKAGGGGYGQNIGAGAPDNEIDAMITNAMYNNEIMMYPGYGVEPDMSSFEKWGHASQIVWKSTTRIGCYTQHCTNGLGGVSSNVSPYFTVCNYQPPGNFGGQYAANVLKPLGQAMVTVPKPS